MGTRNTKGIVSFQSKAKKCKVLFLLWGFTKQRQSARLWNISGWLAVPCHYIQGPLEAGNPWAVVLSVHSFVHSLMQPTSMAWTWAGVTLSEPDQSLL